MTKKETLKIMAMLGAFYGGGKTDPEAQVNAWYAILKNYDFVIAEQAVLNFAENDVRDYATFPAVGKIVQAIRDEECKREAPIKEIIRAVSYGWAYYQLTDRAKYLVSEEKYNEWLDMDAEDFANSTSKIAKGLRKFRDTDIKKLQGEVTDG